ncbi:hypothetical protein RUND412_008356 [Rhizina undulata]
MSVEAGYTTSPSNSFVLSRPLDPLWVESAESIASSKHHHQKEKEKEKGFFSFLSRLGGKNKSLSQIVTKQENWTPTSTTINSIPGTPSTAFSPSIKRSLSIPAFSALKSHVSYPSSPLPKGGPKAMPISAAFAQSIKSASLPASTLSAEAIVRRNTENSKSARDRRGKVLQKSHASTKSADLEWTRKVYILIPGMLLQYPGDGMYDRLPERVLQLTSRSVAFASDVIPGRPWVLQVYHSAGTDGNFMPDKEKKDTFLSKISFKATLKNTCASLLLVFDGAEEMDSWMSTIRAEANRLGGGVHAESIKELYNEHNERNEFDEGEEDREDQDVDEEDGHQHQSGYSQLDYSQPDYRDIGRDPRYSRRIVINRDDSARRHSMYSDDTESKRTSTYYRNSLDVNRSVTTLVSGDNITLDHLRGSRLSVHSGRGVRISTVSTISTEQSQDRDWASNSRRRSTAALSTRSRSSFELRPAALRPLSAIDQNGNLYWIPRTPSPAAPNFSLPTNLMLNGYSNNVSPNQQQPQRQQQQQQQYQQQQKQQKHQQSHGRPTGLTVPQQISAPQIPIPAAPIRIQPTTPLSTDPSLSGLSKSVPHISYLSTRYFLQQHQTSHPSPQHMSPLDKPLPPPIQGQYPYSDHHTHKPRPRRTSNPQSYPISPKSRAAPIAIRKPRPVSYTDTRSIAETMSSYCSPSPSSIGQNSYHPQSNHQMYSQATLAIPQSRTLQRRSMASLTSEVGPPLHPPPSIPLPKIPKGQELFSDSRSGVKSRGREDRERERERSKLVIEEWRSRSLGNRHSFQAVGKGYV